MARRITDEERVLRIIDGMSTPVARSMANVIQMRVRSREATEGGGEVLVPMRRRKRRQKTIEAPAATE